MVVKRMKRLRQLYRIRHRCCVAAFVISICATGVAPADGLAAAAGDLKRGFSGDVAGDGLYDSQLTLEVSIAMASLSYARRANHSWLFGVGGGVGGALGKMLVAGRHFAESGGWAYEDRDGYTNKQLFDVFHGKIFSRYENSPWQIDIGVQGSVFLHWDSSDDDPGAGFFGGVFLTPMFGWRNVKFGPRVLAGYFGGDADANEFGIYFSPLLAGLIFQF